MQIARFPVIVGFNLTLLLDLIDHKDEISVCYGLVDIIFAFAYNKRTTLGENTVRIILTSILHAVIRIID